MNAPRLILQSLVACAIAAGAAGALAAPPEGKVQINYNRCDSNYSGWGAHLFQGGSGGPAISGITWQSPMEPSGKNDFGVYWQFDLNEFGKTGKVNYIIHKGDNKEQGGKDMFFDGNTTKEIWINQGDRNIYTTLDDAKKARAENPCK